MTNHVTDATAITLINHLKQPRAPKKQMLLFHFVVAVLSRKLGTRSKRKKTIFVVNPE